ncbi:MAG: hypothetical protein GC157_11810 [Frankiales bacterium]|nr:hypothetical protein [Frankiales bacterium]
MDQDADPAQAARTQLERTVDRVRAMGLARLEASFEPEPTRAEAVRRAAQRLADLAAALEDEPVRPVPVLAVHAVGDQLAVCGHDLLDAAAGPAATDRAEAARAALVEAADVLLDLRRRL